MNTVEDLAARTAAALESVEARVAEARAALAEVQAEERKLKGALVSLTGEKHTPTGKAAKAKRKASEPWPASPQLIETVYNALTVSEAPLTLKELMALCGRGETSVDKALRALRRDERIRLAGQRGRAYLFAPMGRDR